MTDNTATFSMPQLHADKHAELRAVKIVNRWLSSAGLILCIYNSSAAGEQIVVNCQGSGQPVYLIGGGPAFTS